MADASIALDDCGAITLSGDLVFATVGALLETGSRLVQQQPQAVVDLSAVVRCDSAGLALLIEWVALATANEGRLKFRSPPEALLDIARISHVEALLPRV